MVSYSPLSLVNAVIVPKNMIRPSNIMNTHCVLLGALAHFLTYLYNLDILWLPVVNKTSIDLANEHCH